MSQILRVVLAGQYPSGKNQIKMSAPRAGLIMKFPQASFEKWRAASYSQLDRQRGAWAKLTTPAKITIQCYKGDLIGRDAPGVQDAIFHLLEWCPIHSKKVCRKKECRLPFVANDNLLEGVDFRQPILDRENPRIEILIQPYYLEPQGATP